MIRRHILALVRRSLAEFPAVLLIGARQVGKSTLARQLVREKLLERYVTLDDLATLEASRSDPEGFIAGLPGSAVIDEVQRAPDLLRAVKRTIDAKRRPGRFLLTGSANVLARTEVTESLAGRMDVVRLEGSSVAERLGRPAPSALLGDLFRIRSAGDLVRRLETSISHGPSFERRALRDAVFFGGFPTVSLRRDPRFARRWFSAYLTTYIERDARDLARIQDPVPFGKLLRLAALQTGGLLNVKNLGSESGLDQRTAGRYLGLLETSFQVNRLLPWFAHTRKRLVKTPKIYVDDSGIACHLAGIDTPARLEGHPMNGALLETWAWAELRKLLALTPGIQTGFYRSHQGREVDFVLARGKSLWGIEVKLAASVTRRDLRGVVEMQEALGGDVRGLVLHAGDALVAFSKTLIAAPIRCLL